MKSSSGHLDDMLGHRVTVVAFVQDYVEIHADDDKVLRAFVGPQIVDANGETMEFPALGSRDALCSLIGATVDGIEVEPETHLRVHFSGDRDLIVPLDRCSNENPEAASFSCPTFEGVEVWP